jgi:hypothetical protein
MSRLSPSYTQVSHRVIMFLGTSLNPKQTLETFNHILRLNVVILLLQVWVHIGKHQTADLGRLIT